MPRGRKPGTVFDPETHVTEKQFSSRFKRGSYYAKKAGLPNEYQYLCRNCAITFNRELAKTHYFTTCDFNSAQASPETLAATGLTQTEIDTHRKVSQAYAAAGGRGGRKPVKDKTIGVPTEQSQKPEPFKTARQVREAQVAQAVANPVLDKDQAFSLDIAEIAAYLEWITADRNQARRELESTRDQLSKLRSAELSTDFWNTYNEYKRRS
jgi:hypothetical protein